MCGPSSSSSCCCCSWTHLGLKTPSYCWFLRTKVDVESARGELLVSFPWFWKTKKKTKQKNPTAKLSGTFVGRTCAKLPCLLKIAMSQRIAITSCSVKANTFCFTNFWKTQNLLSIFLIVIRKELSSHPYVCLTPLWARLSCHSSLFSLS